MIGKLKPELELAFGAKRLFVSVAGQDAAVTSRTVPRHSPGASDTLTLGQARRLAIAASGLTRPRADGRVDRRHIRGVLRHTALFQIDSVSTVVRAHYLPLWSRLGAYDRGLLDRMYGELFEYWAHEASLLPVEMHPLLRWRMAEARAYTGIYSGLARFAQEQAAFVTSVLERVRAYAGLHDLPVIAVGAAAAQALWPRRPHRPG